LNIHASLLPRWRGAAPIHRAIEAGDAKTGVTIMQMDAGLDTGDMLLLASVPIEATDATATLHDRLAALGADLIVQALSDAQAGKLQARQQPEAGVTYAHKIEKHEAALDWRMTAPTLDQRIRAFNPFPGATLQVAGEVVKVWRACVESGEPVKASAGLVLQADAHGVKVACGSGVLCLTELQRAGGKRLSAADFLRGFELPVGTLLDAHPDAIHSNSQKDSA